MQTPIDAANLCIAKGAVSWCMMSQWGNIMYNNNHSLAIYDNISESWTFVIIIVGKLCILAYTMI